MAIGHPHLPLEKTMNTALRTVSFTDVRCFAGERNANLSKITLLVGGNSAGKTTFLGCLNALGHLAGLNDLDDRTNCFDQPPFSMGSFDTLARPGSTSFRVAIGLDGGPFSQFAIQFAKGAGDSLKEIALELQLSESPQQMGPTLTMVREASESHSERWRFDGPNFQFRVDQSDVSYTQFTTWLSRSIRYGLLPFAGEVTQFRKRVGHTTNQDLAAFGRFVNFFRHAFHAPKTPLRITPIDPRGLEPRRLYTFNPFGGSSGDTDLEAINDAGRRLGLFNRLEVRQLSRDGFEILADVSGSLRNLSDVGYGVASLLPFLTALASAPPDTIFLVQQPEVHVHPSAQAKLVELMASSDHGFIVETHSDHVIDWFRILVKEKQLAPSDVGIIYLEAHPDDASATRLHQISLDQLANLSGQPRSYRQFFSNETARVLGLPR